MVFSLRTARRGSNIEKPLVMVLLMYTLINWHEPSLAVKNRNVRLDLTYTLNLTLARTLNLTLTRTLNLTLIFAFNPSVTITVTLTTLLRLIRTLLLNQKFLITLLSCNFN